MGIDSPKSNLKPLTIAMDPVQADFRNFLYLVWKHLNLPDPTEVQYDIAQTLQHGPARMVIEAFRGVGKSWITSALVCWLLLCDPQTKILVVSASKTRSDDFSTFTKRLINELPILAHLRPRDGQRDSNIAFDVGPARAAHAPSVKSVGITGQLAGSRANVIIADDVEVQNNSLTQVMRDKLSEAIKEFDAILSPGGRIIYLGTPQTEMSIYNLLPERGYTTYIWPARYPHPTKVASYGDKLAPYVLMKLEQDPSLGTQCGGRGAPVDPQRFNDQDLIEREMSYGRSGFALQFMLDTTLSDAERYPLKLSDLIVMDLNTTMAPIKLAWSAHPDYILEDVPNVGFTGDRYYRPMFIDKDWGEYTGSVLAIDPSGRGKDETGFAVVKILNGMLFVLECGGLIGGYDEATLENLARKARTHSVNLVLIESNFGDGMFTQLFKPYLMRFHPTTVEEVRSTGQKEKRIIDTLEPVMNQHRLVVDKSIIQRDIKTENPQYQLFYQMTRITKDRGAINHDDRLDALEMATRYWVESMARDVDQAAKDYVDDALQKELDRFVEGILGNQGDRSQVWSQGRCV